MTRDISANFDVHGILPINKPNGITSYDVIRKLKPLLPRKYKIGHGGTLDPFATGLLLILIGRFTKKMEYIHTLPKEYIVDMEFGFETDTQDITGRIVKRMENLPRIPRDTIAKKIADLPGDIMQTPPAYSAVKVDGVPAYKLARQNKKVSLKPKPRTIFDATLLSYDWPHAEVRLKVSTGTYIRTIVADLAHDLDAVATATKLIRTRIGDISVEDSITPESVSTQRDLINALIRPF